VIKGAIKIYASTLEGYVVILLISQFIISLILLHPVLILLLLLIMGAFTNPYEINPVV